MIETISTDDTQVTVSTLVEKLDANDRLMIERDGKPVAVLVPLDDYERLEALQDEADWRALDALAQRNAHHDPDVVFADATAAVEAVRRSRAKSNPQRA